MVVFYKKKKKKVDRGRQGGCREGSRVSRDQDEEGRSHLFDP